MKQNYLSYIYSYKDLIRFLADKEVKVKYKSAVLGRLWSLLYPLLLMMVFTVVFSLIFKVQIENFPAFLLCALLPWFYLSFSLSAATTSIVDNSSLIKKTCFPYEVIPLSIVIANLYNFLISLLLFSGFLVFFSIIPGWSWGFLPLVVLLQTVFVLGICLFCSALHTMFRDVKYILELVMLIWFYATPIFYDLSLVPENLRPFFRLNPLTVFIGLYRDILLYARVPGYQSLLAAFIISLGFYGLGVFVFNSFKLKFADVT
jgi:ABC-2 type transport system permease protein